MIKDLQHENTFFMKYERTFSAKKVGRVGNQKVYHHSFEPV
jgi:hypothetical protein